MIAGSLSTSWSRPDEGGAWAPASSSQLSYHFDTESDLLPTVAGATNDRVLGGLIEPQSSWRASRLGG